MAFFQNSNFVHDTSVFITICLNDFLPSIFDTRLTSSYTVSVLVDVEYCSIEELNVSQTDILWDGNGLLAVVTWPIEFYS